VTRGHLRVGDACWRPRTIAAKKNGQQKSQHSMLAFLS